MKEFYNKLIANLNSEQKDAVLTIEGPIRIIASAGSGKTSILCKKIAYLIYYNKILPEKILALTFSNKASHELKNRVINLLPNHKPPIIHTFHSLCLGILREDICKLKKYELKNDFVILNKKDQKTIIIDILKDLSIDYNIIDIDKVIQFISYNKTIGNLPEDDKINPNISIRRKVFFRYEKFLESKKYLDLDDLLIFTERLLIENKVVRNKWSKKFLYYLIDEFQDTSDIQYRIVKLLLSTDNITIVGDPDQTIYSWRGSDINLINYFDRDFPKTKTIIMSSNYRSDEKIINAANKLIKNNIYRIPKSLVSESGEKGNINFFYSSSPETEAKWVIEKINLLKQEKNQLKDICIIFRSNFYSRAIEDALIESSTHFKIIGSEKFLKRKEIMQVFSLLRTIYDFSEIYLLAIIIIPSFNISKETINLLIKKGKELKISIFEVIKLHWKELNISKEQKVNLVNFINIIIKYNKLLSKYNFDVVLRALLKEIKFYSLFEINDEDYRLENINELLKSMESWIKNNRNKTLINYLEEIALTTEKDEGDSGEISAVTLMTIHNSKGSEFKNVFIIGMNESIFPSAKAIESNDIEKLEEERRIAYVAITRAKTNLYITCSSGYDLNNKPIKPSRFIEEMGLNIDKYHFDVPAKKTDKGYIFDFMIGDKVKHRTFGIGIIINITDDCVWIKFDSKDVGEKQFLKTHSSLERIINDY
ncbi:MAG: ATP-dependent helicase [Metamycoplasmataceae bacterium]